MKNFSLVQLVGFLALALTVASCGFTQPVYDEDYEDRRTSRRVYDDPYYSNNNRTTIVRDPYTGQYYEVTPVGPYGASAYPYGSAYPSRRAGYPSRNTRVYDNRTYSDRTYNRSNSTNNTPARSQQQSGTTNGSSKKIEDTRSVINGTAN